MGDQPQLLLLMCAVSQPLNRKIAKVGKQRGNKIHKQENFNLLKALCYAAPYMTFSFLGKALLGHAVIKDL